MKLLNIGMTPVKCTQFHQLDEAYVGKYGIVGDRDFILLDANNVPISSSKHALFLPLHFSYDRVSKVLRLTFPDGRQLCEPCKFSDATYTLDFLGMRNIQVRKVLGKWNTFLSEFSGRKVTLVFGHAPGDGIDVLPITLLSTGSLSQLEERIGNTLDPRRFRTNLIIEHDTPHVEDSWEGKQLSVGDNVILKVRSSVPRCIVTQLDPSTGQNNLRVIPSLMTYREKVHLPDGLMPDYATPGFSSYAEVLSPGVIRKNDRVVVL